MTHYYSRKQKGPLKKTRFKSVLRGKEIEFEAGSGTFSKYRVDLGSALLINEFEAIPGQRILDLGCGYGPIGIAIQKTCSQCDVVMTDVNERAVKLAKSNAKLNKVKVDVRAGDMYDAVKEELFDAILLNPPQRAGRKTCNAMIEQGKEHLKTDGTFWLVGRHRFGGKMFEKKMEDVFGNVETIERQSGFRVYRSKKTI